MKTKDNLHNLHMDKMQFFSPKWQGFFGRQIAFDTIDVTDTYFVLHPKKLDLYLFFELSSTKDKLHIVKLGKLSKDYISAVATIAELEVSILRMLLNTPYEEIMEISESNIKTHLKEYYREKVLSEIIK